MTETTDTSTLDEKNKTDTEKNEDTATKVKNFFVATFNSVLTLIICFILSFLLVYSCKAVQADRTMPLNRDLYPYQIKGTYEDPPIKKREMDIFSNFPWASERVSLKISFEPGNILDGAIAGLREQIAKKNQWFVMVMLCSVIKDVLWCNFYLYKGFFSFIDNTFAEFILFIIGHYILLGVLILSVIVNTLSIVGFWFYNLGWFLKNRRSDGFTKGITFYEWLQFLGGIICIIIFTFVFFTLIFPLIFPISIFFSFITLFSILSSSARLKTKDNKDKDVGDPKTIIDLIWSFLFYHKNQVIIMFTLDVLTHANKYFGSTVAGTTLIIILFLLFTKRIDLSVPAEYDKRYEMGQTNIKQTSPFVNEKPIILGKTKDTNDYSEDKGPEIAGGSQDSERQDSKNQDSKNQDPYQNASAPPMPPPEKQQLEPSALPEKQQPDPYQNASAPPIQQGEQGQPEPSAQPEPSVPPIIGEIQANPQNPTDPSKLVGGKKNKKNKIPKINDDNFMDELKKFHKKYSKILVK